MANQTITQMDALAAAPAADDLLVIVDVSDTTDSPQGTTKKIEVSDLMSAPSGSATIIDETGSPLTLTTTHNGAVVLVDDDVTVPSGLPVGFNCMLIQTGASPVEIIASSTTINNRQGHAHIGGQYGVVTLVSYSSNVYALAGDTDT